jgi:hypothetical protein
MQDTTLTIKQTLDIDPEINFINWELNKMLRLRQGAQSRAPKASSA